MIKKIKREFRAIRIPEKKELLKETLFVLGTSFFSAAAISIITFAVTEVVGVIL